MAGCARIQRICLYLGLIGFAVMVVLMLSSQDQFKTAFDTAEPAACSASPARTDKTIADAAANDAFTGSLEPLAMGDDIMATLGAALVMLPFMLFWILYELGLDPLRRGPRIGRLPQGPARHARRDLGHGGPVDRLRAAAPRPSGGSSTTPPTSTSSTGSAATRRRPDGADLELPAADRVVPHRQHDLPDRDGRLFRAWFLGWSGTLFLSSTRMIFAAAFDRILPEQRRRCRRTEACRSPPCCSSWSRRSS